MRWSQAETLARLAVVFLGWLGGTTLLTRRYLIGRKRSSPNRCAAANGRPAGQSGGSDNLSAIVAPDRAFPAAVAEFWTLDGMRPFLSILSLLGVIACASGCTRTYISTGAPGVPSPDGDTRFCLTAHGAYGRAYTERSKKLLDVWIGRGPYTNEVTLLSHRYKFIGADLWGHVEWISTNEVVMHVYDYGDGVSKYDAGKTGAPSNHIATLSFYLDKSSGKFRDKR